MWEQRVCITAEGGYVFEMTAKPSDIADVSQRPRTAEAVLDWFTARLREIPEALQVSAKLLASTEYGDGSPELVLRYFRPASAAEIRELDQLRLASMQTAHAALTGKLTELQAKYGDSPIVDM